MRSISAVMKSLNDRNIFLDAVLNEEGTMYKLRIYGDFDPEKLCKDIGLNLEDCTKEQFYKGVNVTERQLMKCFKYDKRMKRHFIEQI